MKSRLLTKLRFTFVLLFLTFFTLVFSQTGSISGKVTDADGSPVIGTNVVVVGTSTGTVTDVDGIYSLEIPAGPVKISYSFIGYLTETKQVNLSDGASEVIDIVLSEDMLQLDDVVVIGYGTQKKSDLTGAVASISSEELTATSNSTVEGALQGRASGVRVSSVSGAPGSNTNVFIRGVTSINNSEPLWIVDGVPADPKTVNPNDIESVEILKDAATTAIYGANGGNGVVLITTKKGIAGKTSASLNITQGWQSLPESRFIDMANGPEFGQMYTEYQRILRTREDRIFFSDPETLPTYDYQKEIFRAAPMKDYSLSVAGGNETSKFYLGLGYTDQEGILRNTSYDKITARINSEHDLNKWLTVGEKFSISRQEWDGFEEWQLLNEYHTPILAALQYQPFVPVYVDSLGNAASEKNDLTNWSASPIGNTANPVGTIELLNRGRESTNIKGTAFIKIEPVKGLTMESHITGGITNDNFYSFEPVYFITPSNYNSVSSINRGFSDYHEWNWQNYLTYSNTLFGAHNFTVLVGYESGESWSKDMSATRYNLLTEDPEQWYFDSSLDDTLAAQIPGGGGQEIAGYGYFGRLSYDYKGIVLAQFNVRRDYSSLFGPRNRQGTFPSFSVGLKFTEFSAVKNALPFLSFGKIRYGNGVIGANTLSPYRYFAVTRLTEVYDYSFDNSGTDVTGAARGAMPNPSIKWEKVKTENLGLDLTFLSNKLSFTTEWFRRSNIGMIIDVELAGLAGFRVRDTYQEGGISNPPANVGNMINNGMEFQVGWKEQAGKLKYSLNFNYTYVKTKAGDLPDTLNRGTITGVNGFLTRTIPNGPVSEYFGLQVDRLFMPEDYDEALGVITNQPYIEDPETGDRVYAQPNAKPGDYKFKDINGDHRIDSRDIGPIGNPVPRNNFGLTLDVSYGWFDMNVFLQGATGFKIFNAQKIYSVSTSGAWNWNKDYVDNHYREDIYNRAGDVLVYPARHNAKYPRIDPGNENGNFTNISDFYMENGSYLKVKNVQLGMTLPKEWTERVGIASLRVFCGVQNLFTITAYSGYDPEVGSDNLLVQGLDKGSYPRARMYKIGANVKF